MKSAASFLESNEFSNVTERRMFFLSNRRPTFRIPNLKTTPPSNKDHFPTQFKSPTLFFSEKNPSMGISRNNACLTIKLPNSLTPFHCWRSTLMNTILHLIKLCRRHNNKTFSYGTRNCMEVIRALSQPCCRDRYTMLRIHNTFKRACINSNFGRDLRHYSRSVPAARRLK